MHPASLAVVSRCGKPCLAASLIGLAAVAAAGVAVPVPQVFDSSSARVPVQVFLAACYAACVVWSADPNALRFEAQGARRSLRWVDAAHASLLVAPVLVAVIAFGQLASEVGSWGRNVVVLSIVAQVCQLWLGEIAALCPMLIAFVATSLGYPHGRLASWSPPALGPTMVSSMLYVLLLGCAVFVMLPPMRRRAGRLAAD